MLRSRMSPAPRRHIPPRGPPKLSARDRALAAWRGVETVRTENANARAAKSASQLVAGLTKELRLAQRQAETEILSAWNQLIDPNITAHAQPVGYNPKTGTLFVNVDHSAWLTEIVRYRRKEILDRLQHSFGREKIAKISFRLG